MSDVSVIGLGDMGAALVRALLGKGYRVTVWNRTGAKAEPLIQRGATLAPDVAAAISASPVVIICVSDYDVTHRLLETGDVAGRVLVQLSTGTPQEARDGEAWARERGAEYLDGAIFAMPKQVGKPDTPIYVSGAAEAFQKSKPLLRALAGNLQYTGESVGEASAWDLAFLSHVFGGFLGFLHGARIFETEGIRVDALGSLLADIAPVIGEMMRHASNAIQADDYSNPESSLQTSGYALDLLLKQARESGISSDFPALGASLFQKGVEAGYGLEETAALIKVLR